jgi:hypothetical protein
LFDIETALQLAESITDDCQRKTMIRFIRGLPFDFGNGLIEDENFQIDQHLDTMKLTVIPGGYCIARVLKPAKNSLVPKTLINRCLELEQGLIGVIVQTLSNWGRHRSKYMLGGTPGVLENTTVALQVANFCDCNLRSCPLKKHKPRPLCACFKGCRNGAHLNFAQFFAAGHNGPIEEELGTSLYDFEDESPHFVHRHPRPGGPMN